MSKFPQRHLRFVVAAVLMTVVAAPAAIAAENGAASGTFDEQSFNLLDHGDAFEHVGLDARSAAAMRPYKSTRVTYRDLSKFPEAVRLAAESWNHTGTKLRLVPTAPGRRADIVVRSRPRVRDTYGNEFGGLGGIGMVLFAEKVNDVGTLTPRQVRGLAHEFGHALGLPHNRDDCALLGDGGDDHPLPRCNVGVTPGDGQWRCGPSKADAAALARFWGLKRKPVRLGWCTADQAGRRWEGGGIEIANGQITISGRNSGGAPLSPGILQVRGDGSRTPSQFANPIPLGKATPGAPFSFTISCSILERHTAQIYAVDVDWNTGVTTPAPASACS
jgi:hypothetical protein